MGLEITWYDVDQTILVATIAKNTTWADYHNAIDQIVAQADGKCRVDVVFVDDVGMPTGYPLNHLRQGIFKLMQQPNIRMSLIAGSKGSTGLVRAVIESIGRAFGGVKDGIPDIFAPTLDEAIARIQADRARQ